MQILLELSRGCSSIAPIVLTFAVLFSTLGTADKVAARDMRKGGGWYKVGMPYQINGRWYTPGPDELYEEIGIASWYGGDFHGRRTANGEIYDMNALTAAHKTLPMPSYIEVTNLENGRTLLLRLNDRGPYVDGRIIDLSRASARLLGFENQGSIKARVAYVGPAPLDGTAERELAYLAEQPWYPNSVASATSVVRLASVPLTTGSLAANAVEPVAREIVPKFPNPSAKVRAHRLRLNRTGATARTQKAKNDDGWMCVIFSNCKFTR